MNETQQAWLSKKAQLKKDICTYFFSKGLDKKAVTEICQEIKYKGTALVEIAKSFKENWLPITPEEIDNYFPPHRQLVADFINRYAALYKESLDYLKNQRNYGEKTRWGRDDYETADWESTQPVGEIQVHSDRVKVIAFEYVEEFAASLPKKWKREIDNTLSDGYEWEYPLSELEKLKKLGLPILFDIAVNPDF